MGSFSLLSCMAGFLISDTPGGGDPLSDPSAYKKLLGQKTLGPAPASAKPTSSDREVKSSMNDPSGQVPRYGRASYANVSLTRRGP